MFVRHKEEHRLSFSHLCCRALKVSQLVAERAFSVASHPPSAAEAISAPLEGAQILGSSTYTLENNTGRGVCLWVGHEQQESLDDVWEQGTRRGHRSVVFMRQSDLPNHLAQISSLELHLT